VLYALFSAACAFAFLLLIAQLFNWPLGIKLLTVLTLALCTVLFAGVLALSFVLKAGNDG